MGAYEETELPMFVNGNVYLNGAREFGNEKMQLILAENPDIRIEERGKEVFRHRFGRDGASVARGKKEVKVSSFKNDWAKPLKELTILGPISIMRT